MQKHDTEYCDFRELTALIMTWNAGASKPTHLRHDEQDSNFFRDLLRGPKESPDFVVFGFQELVDLEDKKVTAKNLFKSSKKKDSSEKEHMAKQYRAWRDHLSDCLNTHMPSREPYTLLHTADLVGLFSCVFVKTSLRSSIADVNAAEIKLGMKGRYGNKGALVVRFMVDDSSICFVNCHLAAGQRQTAHRNNDIAAIMEASALRPQPDPQMQLDMFVSGGDGSMILDHEICILNGDLNYRIDAMSREIVIREIQNGNLPKLLEKDQLLLSRKRNPGFRLRAFQEKEITFPPTYKYDVGSDKYDTSEKRRSPAWCDRVLYRGMGRIKQVEYRRHEVRVSDHRPVSAQFRLRVKTIDRRRQGAARQASEERFEEVRQRIAMDIK
jgi:endonuclease/exonuclease/phosphatase family metal-dependent hydrolase